MILIKNRLFAITFIGIISCSILARPSRPARLTRKSSRTATRAQKKVTPIIKPAAIKIPAPPIVQKSPLYWDWKQIDTSQLYFPSDFGWGVATSAHQVEGNCSNNDWAAWEKNHCKAKTGSACDHWNRYKEDIQLIKDNKFDTYRLSIEWSKVEPKPGHFDEKALEHYEDVCKELIKNNIKPLIVFHHYTSPWWFAQMGGFEKTKNIPYFVAYCKKVFERLNQYTDLWLTLNSPTSYVARAYHKKMAPPGLDNMQLMQETLKNMLEAHVQVYHAVKAMPGGEKSKIGYSHNVYHIEAKSFWDKTGANYAYKLFDSNIYTFFKTGQFNVHVPFKVSLRYANPKAKGALDFVGLSFYSHGQMTNFNVGLYPGDLPTQTDVYTIYPEGMYRAVMQITQEFANPLQIPIYITENGVATNNEKHRAIFFERTLFALSYAMCQGCPVKGYIVWTLFDNYEWGSYGINYGLYAIDFKTMERSKTPREGTRPLLNIVEKFVGSVT